MTGPAIRELEAPRRNWMIPLILVALALLAIPVLRGLRRPSTPAAAAAAADHAPVPAEPAARRPAGRRRPTPTPPAPAARPRSRARSKTWRRTWPGSGETTPHAFSPSPLTFAFGSAMPTPESMKTLDDIATVLKAHPSATIRVESHTDSIGTPGVQPEPVAGARRIDQERAGRPRRRGGADRDRRDGPGSPAARTTPRKVEPEPAQRDCRYQSVAGRSDPVSRPPTYTANQSGGRQPDRARAPDRDHEFHHQGSVPGACWRC